MCVSWLTTQLVYGTQPILSLETGHYLTLPPLFGVHRLVELVHILIYRVSTLTTPILSLKTGDCLSLPPL